MRCEASIGDAWRCIPALLAYLRVGLLPRPPPDLPPVLLGPFSRLVIIVISFSLSRKDRMSSASPGHRPRSSSYRYRSVLTWRRSNGQRPLADCGTSVNELLVELRLNLLCERCDAGTAPRH
jgi:hypothetical protein